MTAKNQQRPIHERLTLRNFTVFKDQTIDFVDDVNVFVGENGTGKTHAMKALYAFHKTQASTKRTNFRSELLSLFQIDDLHELVSKDAAKSSIAEVSGQFGGHPWAYGIQRAERNDILADSLINPRLTLPIFIPAIDMIGHSKGFVESSSIVELDFDSTCLDLLSFLGSKGKGVPVNRRALDKKLREVVDGEIEQDETKRFYLVNDRGRFSMPMVAEGIRKVATLRRLVENNWIVRGTTLFWDEPEVNLNPRIMDEVVEALLLICRQGVQVFIASHSYVILKELEVNAKKGDSLRFFGFETTDSGTVVHPSDSYLELHPNPIERQYAELYDRQVAKEIEAVEKEVARDKA